MFIPFHTPIHTQQMEKSLNLKHCWIWPTPLPLRLVSCGDPLAGASKRTGAPPLFQMVSDRKNRVKQTRQFASKARTIWSTLVMGVGYMTNDTCMINDTCSLVNKCTWGSTFYSSLVSGWVTLLGVRKAIFTLPSPCQCLADFKDSLDLIG